MDIAAPFLDIAHAFFAHTIGKRLTARIANKFKTVANSRDVSRTIGIFGLFRDVGDKLYNRIITPSRIMQEFGGAECKATAIEVAPVVRTDFPLR